MKNKIERNRKMDKFKKLIGPILIAVYLLYILFTTEIEKVDTSLSYLMRSISPIPENMIKALVITVILSVISIALYFYFKEAGEKK